MGGFNVFEGARRIARLLKALWMICVAAVWYLAAPSVSLTFVTTHPDGAFAIAGDDCDVGTDAIEWVTRSIDRGRSISARLCFKAQEFASSQRRLVPYRVDKDGVWGNGPYYTA